MNKQKTFWVSFLVLASVLVVMSFASADVNISSVKVNSLETIGSSGSSVAVLAGNTVPLTITFTATSNESNVRLRAEFQGVNGDVQNEVFVGDVETGQTYVESLTLTVPSNIGSVQSDNLNLVVTVWNGDFQKQTNTIV